MNDEPLIPRINYLLASQPKASRLIIVDDVDGAPLTELQRQQLLDWYDEVRANPDLVVRTTIFGGDSVTTIRPRTEGGT